MAVSEYFIKMKPWFSMKSGKTLHPQSAGGRIVTNLHTSELRPRSPQPLCSNWCSHFNFEGGFSVPFRYLTLLYISLGFALHLFTDRYKSLAKEQRTMQTKNEGKFGFTINAENLNGRMAMIGFVAALLTELVTGQGVLHFLGLV
jgi:hypothetical protein